MKFINKEKLAKYSIEYYLHNNKIPDIKDTEVAKDLLNKGACFTTIYVDNKLRGCIGDCEAYEPLYKNIIRNSIHAATIDYRFEPVTLSDLPNLRVSISVLTIPQIYKPENKEELIKFLKKVKPGLIIEKGGNRALFLPQVWEELSQPQDFLMHLCLKAGLDPNDWQKKEMNFRIFRTDKTSSNEEKV